MSERVATDAEPAGEQQIPAYRPPRAPRPIFAGTAAHRFPELRRPRAALDRLRVHHLDLTRRMIEVADGNLYWPDFLLGAMLQRSYGLVEAVIDCVDSYNLVAAAPLLRMQLDTLVRVCFVTYAPSADDVVQELLKGTEFRKMKDAEGRQLTDARLVELAEPQHPWVKAVYQQTSGWVHFSPHHVHSAWQIEGAAVSGGVPMRPGVVPATLWLELLSAMVRATEEFFGYVELWESRKGLPLGQARPWPGADGDHTDEERADDGPIGDLRFRGGR